MSTNPMAIGTMYETLFGLTFDQTPKPANYGEVLTDGNIIFNLHHRLPGHRIGLDHFGIEVDDLDVLFDRIRSSYPSIGWVKRPPNCPYPGYLSHDPAGSIFALSEKDAAGGNVPKERSRTVNFARWSKGNPEDRYFHHYAIRTRKLEECAAFYEEIFGFIHTKGTAGDPNHYLTDGRLTLMLLPWSIQDYGGISVTGRGPDHIGFKVEDAAIVQSEIEEFFSHFSPGQAPLWLLENTNKSSDESRIRADMIRNSCPISRYEFTDKDGVFVVIGDKNFADL